jgi:threonine synthase
MAELKAKGRYSISPELIEEYAACFEAGFATEQDTTDTIFNNFDIYDYILDPHTAVAAYVYNEYILGGDMTPTVIVSTANPYKFSRDVYAAISEGSETDDFSAIRRLNLLTGFEVPEGLAELKNLPRRFTEVLDKTELINKILDGQ